MAQIICAGLVTVDIVLEVAAFPDKGRKSRANTQRITAGGGALYAAAAVVALGGRAGLAGRIGDDGFGAIVRSALDNYGIDGRLLQAVPGKATPCSAILVTPDGERTIINHRDAELFSQGLGAGTPGQFDAVLADTRWPRGAAELLAASRAAGRPGVVDAEAPTAPAAEALSLASHIIFSEQGLGDYMGACDGHALVAAARQLGAWVAVTRGPAPVLWHDGRRGGEIAVFPAISRDTLGAGDVWHGAFALSLAQGHSEYDAVRRANAAAAIKVARREVLGALPTASEVDALCAKDRRTRR